MPHFQSAVIGLNCQPFVNATLSNSQQSLALIGNLLSLPRFQSAVISLNWQPFDSALLPNKIGNLLPVPRFQTVSSHWP